ncbi:MAG: glycosyltransferase family 4 protein [Candidatus Eisenbacteria bacterium]|nr:glycosyltransferase family 4 protein [Candidatus Eisenbacteria bacterium]
MTVLMCNKYYFVKGGAERYLFELSRILESKGHRVVPFAMRHERNEPSEHSEAFVSHEGFDGDGGAIGRLRAAARVIYSVEARRKIERLVDRVGPDIAHAHNIAHQLSPSILYGLAAKGVPVVQTLHDYKLVCPNYSMFVDGENCERCATWRYWNACARRCMRGALAPSALVCLEAYAHRLLGSYARHVALFIAPSRSLRDRVIAHGVSPDKVVHLPYAIDLSGYAPTYADDGYAVYVGRLSAGKGIGTLLGAAALAPEVRIKVVGAGPLLADLEALRDRERLSNVEFVGHHTGEELKRLMAGATFVVVPSECFENSPLTVYEALALGKAVVGSDIGGIPELLGGEAGVLFPAGDREALAERLRSLWGDRPRAAEMGRRARARAEGVYGPESHYERLMDIYGRVVH